MTTRTLLLILAAAALAVSVAPAQPAGGSVTVSNPPAAIWSMRIFDREAPPDLLKSARLILAVGKERVPATSRNINAYPPAAGPDVTTPVALPLQARLSFRTVGGCTVWDVACTNTGQQQLWLEVGPELLLKRTGPLSFFDGWDDFADPQKLTLSEKLAGNMPLTCAWNEQTTLAIGLEPSQLVSYLRHDYEPQPDSTARLSAVTRLVLDPGQTENVSFVTMAAPGQWGKYEAFQVYYDSFPQWFSPNPLVDARASMGSAQYVSWPPGPWSPEIARRLHGGWDWCYAPFKRTGDIVGRPELWDYQPARQPDKTRSLPREEYLKWRAERFADGAKRCDVAMMFYIPSQVWCEETLARERYADALTTDPKAKTYFDTPWVTGHDNELRVFPYETTFGKQSYEDLAEVARTLDISGFAFDTAGDGIRYLGPALPRLPHRAWDPTLGVYCDELVAVAKLMDRVHTLQKDGRPLAVVSNPMANGTYSSCFHSDSAMLERSPWRHTRTESDRLRWKMGRKTIVWWEGYDLAEFIDSDTITGEQLTTVYRGLADFTILQSLRVGYIPPPSFTHGVARLARWLPAITECVQTGWEPVPAVRVPEPLWASRYGKGLSTLIAVAHETADPVRAELAIENARLGPGAYLFSHYDGSEMTNRVSNSDTVIPTTAPVRTPVLLRAQMNVTPATAVQAAVVSTQTGIAGGTLTANLTGTGAAAIKLRIPAGMRLAGVTVDSQRVTCSPAGELKLTLKPQTKLVATFASELFALKDSDLLDFAFVKDGQPNCTLVIPPGASERTRHAAYRLQEYWRYWYGRIVQPPADVLLPIAEAGQPVPGLQVRFMVRAGQPARVALEGSDLVIQAPDDAALVQTTLRVLGALDRKYWTAGNLYPGSLHNRTGLANTAVE